MCVHVQRLHRKCIQLVMCCITLNKPSQLLPQFSRLIQYSVLPDLLDHIRPQSRPHSIFLCCYALDYLLAL